MTRYEILETLPSIANVNTAMKSLLYPLTLIIIMSAPLPALAFTNNFSNLFVHADEKKNGGKGLAAQKAKSQYGGKVLSVSEIKRDGKNVYKVKLLLDSGRIKIVTISHE